MDLKQSLESYLAALASNSATPGGGAAAALSAAQATALFSMVARLSKDESVDWAAHAQQMDDYRLNFSKLARDDADAFDKVMDAYKLPQGDQRTETLQNALKLAATPPLETVLSCWEILHLCRPFIEAANKNVVTDSGIAVSLLKSAIESSMYNVFINLKFIKDEDYKKGLNTKTSLILDELDSITKTLSSLVYSRI
jgi:methenyltetrahydrofolate cyclohydrolase